MKRVLTFFLPIALTVPQAAEPSVTLANEGSVVKDMCWRMVRSHAAIVPPTYDATYTGP